MSLNHSRSICKGKGQEAQFDVAVRLFFLEGEESRLCQLKESEAFEFCMYFEMHSRKEQHPEHPSPRPWRGLWEGRRGFSLGFAASLLTRVVCQMAPLPRKPRAVGSFKLPGWPGGKSVELLFWEEGGKIQVHVHTRVSEEQEWNEEYSYHSTALASRSSKEMQIVPNEEWLLCGFGMALCIIPALSPGRWSNVDSWAERACMCCGQNRSHSIHHSEA